jgi:retron-type reverse transcriptase
MRSPRFDIRALKLKSIFSPSNIEKIWREKVRLSMKEQYVVDGIENFDFHIYRKIESKKLSNLVLSGQYVPQKAQRILVEKSKGLCRQLVIPSVRDAIVLQCLSDALYQQVKGKAPTSQAFFEPKDHKFSTSRSEYGTFASWLNFQKELFNFSKSRKFVVVTDIANYYDTISYSHLRNVLAPIGGVDECIIDMLIYVLADLLWQPDYTPRIEVGLPQINIDAPRLLA